MINFPKKLFNDIVFFVAFAYNIVVRRFTVYDIETPFIQIRFTMYDSETLFISLRCEPETFFDKKSMNGMEV